MNSKLKLAEVINQRKSSRVFQDKSISETILINCAEAARWAPSSSNMQPWRFIIVDKVSPIRQALEDCLAPGNSWAKAAPILVAVCADHKDDPDVDGTEYYAYDTGMAMMSFVLQAQYEGVRCHQMAGFQHEQSKQILQIPASATIFALMAMGYEGELSTADPELQAKETKPRTRKPLSAIAFKDTYGQSLEK